MTLTDAIAEVREFEVLELVELAVATLVALDELNEQYPEKETLPEPLLKYLERLEEVADEYRELIGAEPAF